MKCYIGKKVIITNRGMLCSTHKEMAEHLGLKSFVNGWGGADEHHITKKIGTIVGYESETHSKGCYGVNIDGIDLIFRHYFDRVLPFDFIEHKLFDEDFLI